jgi:EAL domain-containing protein (putative c-di-GMP-specific phosphodiesterase class I)
VATPDTFIRVLEETGLILPVGRWVLEQAAHQVVAWRRAGLPWLRVAVNLSARQLRQGDLVQTVAQVLAASGLPSAHLELELTESMLMGGEQHEKLLHQLSALGVQLAIDDFGTGWSSLSYLKRFNVDTLKIDRSFVRDTPHDAEDMAITAAVIALARSLKLRVVAEGVETPAQQRFLRERGCDEYQGWLLSRPLAAPAFETWWRQQLLLDSEHEIEQATLP